MVEEPARETPEGEIPTAAPVAPQPKHQSTRRVAFYTIGAQAAGTLLTLVSGPILGRLIGPSPYGLLAPAQTVGLLGKLIAESGFAYHTVSAKSLSPGEARSLHRQSMRLAFWVSLPAGILAAALGDVPTWVRAFRGAMAIASVMLAGAAAVPTAWAQRVGHLARLEWLRVATQAATAFFIAVPVALLHARLSAATANLMLPGALAVFVAWYLSGLGRSKPITAHIDVGYRVGILGANVGSYLAASAGLLVLATYLSTDLLGIFSRATMLASLPGTVIGAALGRVGWVTLSKSDLWTDHRRFLLKATGLTLAGFSVLILASFLGLNITALAFGHKFSTPPVAFALLTLSQLFVYAASLLDVYLKIQRRLVIVATSMTVQGVVTGALFLVYRPTGLLAISWTLLGPSLLRYIVMVFAVSPRWRGLSSRPSSDAEGTT